MRVFASVGVGLIGWRESFKPDEGVVKDLLELLSTKTAAAEIQVGPALALQLIKSQEAVPQMIEIFKDPEADKYVRAHIGVALGKCGAKQAIGELLKGLEDKENYVSYASAIALGLLVSKDDRDAVNKVIKYADSAADRGTKNFCLIALGEIGDPKGQALLLQKVKNGQIADATFAALALGVMGNKFPTEAAQAGPMLLDVYKESKDMKKAAVAIGLALCNYTNAAEVLRKDLADAGGGNQELKGHLCTALGLLGDKDSIPAIQDLVKQKGDQDLRRRAAIALGLLKDPNAVKLLEGVIQESAASKAILGEATKALGFVGDRKAVPVLRDMVENKKNDYLDVTRAFATVALGYLGDKDDIPLLSRIHENSNYLAQTEALAELLTIL
jgi:HEAT repeat protein